MGLWSKGNTRRMEIVSIEPLSVFSVYTAVFIVLSIPALLILDALGKIRLSKYVSFIPDEGFFAAFDNPFTIALLAGIAAGLVLGMLALIFALIYNCFASVMGGVKIDIRD